MALGSSSQEGHRPLTGKRALLHPNICAKCGSCPAPLPHPQEPGICRRQRCPDRPRKPGALRLQRSFLVLTSVVMTGGGELACPVGLQHVCQLMPSP